MSYLDVEDVPVSPAVGWVVNSGQPGSTELMMVHHRFTCGG